MGGEGSPDAVAVRCTTKRSQAEGRAGCIISNDQLLGCIVLQKALHREKSGRARGRRIREAAESQTETCEWRPRAIGGLAGKAKGTNRRGIVVAGLRSHSSRASAAVPTLAGTCVGVPVCWCFRRAARRGLPTSLPEVQ